MPHLTEAYPGHAAADASGGARGKCISRQRGRRRLTADSSRPRSWRIGAVGSGEGGELDYSNTVDLRDYVHAGRHT